jgi:HNH endonuclease
MERFRQTGFRDELDGSKIHRLSNILTLDHSLHTYFNKLVLWLEADDVSQDETYEFYSDL